MRLTSYERHLLARFIEMRAEDRARVLDEARQDQSVSGSLLHAYKEVLNLI